MLINLHALARASGRVLVAHSSDPGLGAPYQGRPRSSAGVRTETYGGFLACGRVQTHTYDSLVEDKKLDS